MLEELEDLYNRAPCGYHTLDSDGIFVRINDTELEWLGYERDQLIHKARVTELLTPGSRRLFEANFPRLKSEGSLREFELEFLRSDRSVLHTLSTAAAVRDKWNGRAASRWILLDIGEGTLPQNAWPASEHGFRRALEEGPLGFALVGRDHGFLHVNNALCRMLGYEPQELTAKTIEEITHPEDRPTGAALADQFFRGEIPFYQLSKRYLKKNGGIIWANMTRSAVRDRQGEFLFALMLVEDITESRRSHEALRISEERFRVALKNSPVVVFNQDRELRYTWINRPVLAWAEQDFIGKTDLGIISGPDGERLMAIKRSVLESGVGARVEADFTFHDEKYYFDLTVEPLRDSAGIIQGVTCACMDVTPMKRAAAERERLIEELARAQRELLERNHELEALNNEKARWLGIATHDLRNPLSAMLANYELLMERAPMFSKEDRDALTSIYASGTYMLGLLNDVLDISALESGDEPHFPELADLPSLVDESIALCRPLADRKGTRIEAFFEMPAPVIRMDRQKMRQVLVNLIENAIKYSQNGALVQLAVARGRGDLLITVRDNGPGIAHQDLGSIFTPFHRTAARAASKERGTGLGLAICKRIIERHGGKIWAESVPGKGSAFHLSLAIDEPSGEAREAGN
jgi:PAS domain S-box-containing protein